MPLLIIKFPQKMQAFAETTRLDGKIIGLVPTMGALHKGHLKLVEIARKKSDIVIVSIFVNPAQFGPDEDLSRYPRSFKEDCAKLELAGAQVVFHPSVKDIYPDPYLTYINVEKISGILEGARRPGHFGGVATICAKLFNITKPHLAVFGQKDGQQLAIIQKMVRDLNFDIDIMRAPIVRTTDGIAMSSRHSYLNKDQLEKAAIIKRSLDLAQKMIKQRIRDVQKIEAEMRSLINSVSEINIDYIAFNRWDSLEPVVRLEGDVIISLVVVIGEVRLLDNIIIKA